MVRTTWSRKRFDSERTTIARSSRTMVPGIADSSLVTDTLIYLGAAVVCVPLAKRLDLGSVLGYLIAGVAIGPWGLGLVGDPHSTLQFAEFGVVLMLFLIGLEIDLNRLTALRTAVFRGGSMQMLTCAALLAVAFA